MKTKTITVTKAENNNEKNDKATPIRPIKLSKTSEQKWGKRVMDLGFCIVPSLLLRAQNRLGLNPTQLAVLIQLCDFWWENERKPHPGKELLSKRLGISKRQLQRHIADLEQAGLIQRVERHHAGNGGNLSNIYDPSGLVAKLRNLEPEFREAYEKAEETRKAVSRRGYSLVAPKVKKTA